MTTDRRLYDMDLGRRDHARWLGVHRVSSRLTLPTANLLAAYDARVGVTDVSGACSAWADQSGNGFHATQGTAYSRPTITTSDGYASLMFNGTNNYLINTGITAASGPKTVYAVLKPGTQSGYGAIHNSGTPFILLGLRSTSGNFHGVDTADRNSGLAYGSTRCRVAFEIQSGSFTVWKNGTASTPTTWSGSNLQIGGVSGICATGAGANRFTGNLHAMFIYSAARNTAVEDYITQEWGV